MIDGIISGVLVLPPKRLFTRRASPYVIGKIDVMAVRQDGQPVHGNVIAFDAGVCTALLAMSKGDTVSLGGIITPKLADDYGQAVVELNITALAVLSGYPDYHWLIVSDINVAIALFVAWLFGNKQDSYTYTVRVKSDEHSERIAEAASNAK